MWIGVLFWVLNGNPPEHGRTSAWNDAIFHTLCGFVKEETEGTTNHANRANRREEQASENKANPGFMEFLIRVIGVIRSFSFPSRLSVQPLPAFRVVSHCAVIRHPLEAVLMMLVSVPFD